MSAVLAFHPELSEYKQQAVEGLAAHGIKWFTAVSTVDLCHENHGLEVCGIAERADADKILGILRGLFPAWRYARVCYRDYERDRGWKVVIERDPERDTAW